MVRGAIRTDFILSAEIMVIALNEVADEPFLSRAIILVIVALVITALVYGVVGAHREDGRHRPAPRETEPGSAAVRAGAGGRDADLLTVLSTVGIVAMLWVGGHILLVGVDTLGWHWLYDLVHTAEKWVAHAVPAAGSALAWLVNTLASALVGLLVGAIAVAVMHVLPLPKKKGATAH